MWLALEIIIIVTLKMNLGRARGDAAGRRATIINGPNVSCNIENYACRVFGTERFAFVTITKFEMSFSPDMRTSPALLPEN